MALLWIAYLWPTIALNERVIDTANIGNHVTAVQLAWNWTHGFGWSNTYGQFENGWWWGAHHRPIMYLLAPLSQWSDSPWTLSRLSTVLVALGMVLAWRLGSAEAGPAFGFAAAVVYAFSPNLIVNCLGNFSDLLLVAPAGVAIVLASRHGPPWAVVVSVAVACAVREEMRLLSIFFAFAGGWRPAVIGALTAAGCSVLTMSQVPNTGMAFVELLHRRGPSHGPLSFETIDYPAAFFGVGTGLGVLWLAPTYLAAAAAFVILHDQPYLIGEFSQGLAFAHHYMIATTLGVLGAILGCARVERRMPRLGTALLLLSSAGGYLYFRDVVRDHDDRHPADSPEHPAWALIRKAPRDAVLFVPDALYPAAAQRRWVVSRRYLELEGSMPAGSAVVPPIDFAILRPGQAAGGELVAEEDGWRLVSHPDQSALMSFADPP